MAASEVTHVVHAPSNPPGWTAGKWGEWYPDVLGPDKKLTIKSPKPYWQPGWLKQHDPGPSREITRVHGDFRHGNLIIGNDGVRAVLDWEIAHLGDPMEDLGWICTNSWRFGEIDKPVGGFGSREDLFAGYEEAGRKVYPDRVMFWEVMGSLRWGIMCGRMMQRFRNAPDHPMEQAVIGRRPSETEIDLLRLLAPRWK